MTDLMTRFRGPGHFANPTRVPQERGRIWNGEIQPTPFVGRARNKSDRVVIDDDSITVIGSAGTVIIDGTSNMFKIAVSGSLSLAVTAGTAPNNNGATTTVTFPALGALGGVPAHVSYVSFDNATNGNVRQGMREIAYFLDPDVASDGHWKMAVDKDASLGSYREVTTLYGGVQLGVSNASNGTITGYAKYHLLIEAAL